MNDELDGFDPEAARKLFDDRTTEEIVRDMIAAEPGKHSTTLQVRLQRALDSARAGSVDQWEAYGRLRVEQTGGQWDEMLPGNKPRFTVDEETGAVKDHLEGLTYLAPEDPRNTADGYTDPT